MTSSDGAKAKPDGSTNFLYHRVAASHSIAVKNGQAIVSKMPVATPKNSKETGSSMKKSKKTPMKEATPMKSAKENVTPSNKKVAKAKPSGLVLEHSDNLPDKKAVSFDLLN